ncbi:RDD family protein [Olivibacter sp. SDN3]|uniref:RDD family protein n=1 Tax=Olivibacter sp. SDN3 TaxID=2764720 RepID=UPI001650DDD0|nr:RDD family protein [Olivibacter sp. SDN3]QNL51461.1 RDD family protein [Olivibacter sp. SDN3]
MYYYIVKGGKPEGPFQLEDLKSMGLSGTDFVKPEGYDDYKELRELPDLCQELGVRHERAAPQYYATLDVRLLAAAIDYFFAFIIYCLAALAVLIKVDDGSAQGKEEQWMMLVFGLGLIPIVKFLVNVIAEGSRLNASPGKLLLQIRVTDMQGNPIGLGRSFLRNVAKITCVITFGIGYLTGFFDRKQQCFHDKIAKTLVIKGRLI